MSPAGGVDETAASLIGQTPDVSWPDVAGTWLPGQVSGNCVGPVCGTVTPLDCSLCEHLFATWATFGWKDCVVKHTRATVTGPMHDRSRRFPPAASDVFRRRSPPARFAYRTAVLTTYFGGS